jgi:hypothetical protein
MDHIYTLVAAGLAIFSGFGHAFLGETNLLTPLFREGESTMLTRRRARDLLRLVWHLAGAIWILIGLFLLLFPEDQPLRILAIVIFAVSALANFVALRKLHIGCIGLGAASLSLLLG